MKKIALLLTAVATSLMLSGCVIPPYGHHHGHHHGHGAHKKHGHKGDHHRGGHRGDGGGHRGHR